MRNRLMVFFVIFCFCCITANAWDGYTLKQLHIDGRYLCDPEGNHVTLHGFGQTYSPYFNGYAWCKNADGSVNWNKVYDADACVTWNKEQISLMLDKGWKVNWLRLHMDPHWSNTPGQSTSGESDISAFSEERLKTYLQSVFIPMAKHAIASGMYVVMRPPGVCPQQLSVGDSYHQYLRKVWSIVCSDSYLKNNPYIMFELANEPILMDDGSGNYSSYTDGSQQKCTEFFQTIVDDIRALGCNNILWVPGLSYQMNYQGYVKYPVTEPQGTVTGWGIGYAVHCYPGWYGSDSESDTGSEEQGVVTKGAGYTEFQAGWDAYVGGIAQKAPILVTEMDWAPQKYNSSWGKATTGTLGGVGFGANFRYIMDKTGNVSWMLFTNAEILAQYDDSAPDGSTFLTDPEACPRPVYRWYEEYADPDWKFDDVLADQLWYFPNTNAIFSPSIWETGSVTKNDDGSHTIITGQYGFAGWKFSGGIDLSAYKYLVVNLKTAPTSGGWSLRLFDVDNYWDKPYMTDVNGTMIVVNLQSMTNEYGAKVDPSHIYILGFWSYGGSQLTVKDIYVTNNEDYSSGISEVSSEAPNTQIYTLSGQRFFNINSLQKGTIYIYGGKKNIKQ